MQKVRRQKESPNRQKMQHEQKVTNQAENSTMQKVQKHVEGPSRQKE